MPATIYTHDEFWLVASDDSKRPLLTASVCIEVDFFRDGAWTIVDVGLVDYDHGRETLVWDIPVGVAALIRDAAMGRHRASIDEFVFAECSETYGSARRIA